MRLDRRPPLPGSLRFERLGDHHTAPASPSIAATPTMSGDGNEYYLRDEIADQPPCPSFGTLQGSSAPSAPPSRRGRRRSVAVRPVWGRSIVGVQGGDASPGSCSA